MPWAKLRQLKGAILEAARLRPAMILMELRLPDGDSIKVCREIKTTQSETDVLFLVSCADNRLERIK